MRHKPDNSQWTDEQWLAITAGGSDILVAAAAGSGKTAVLVERIIQKIIYEGINIDEILVATFTNASAKEMKERIHQALKREMLQRPSEHLKVQLNKIHSADITTLHSFCLKLIEQYYYTIDLDPVFRTASDEEGALLLMQSLDEVMESHYAEPTEIFLQTNMHLSSDRHDNALRETVRRLYYFAVAHPYPEAWLDSLSELYREIGVDQPVFEQLNMMVKEQLQQVIRLFNEALELLDNPAYEKQYQAVSPVVSVLEQLDGDISQLYEQLNVLADIKWPAFRVAKEYKDLALDKEQEEDAKQLLNTGRKLIDSIKEQFLYTSPQEMAEDIRQMAPEVELLSTLTKELIVRFARKKRERKILDFNDYEHFALDILTADGGKSAIAEMLTEHYKEVLVDEYQDTNRVQERIVQLLNDNHLFMVGDVKQSIYKFRQAEPKLFQEKYQQFKETDAGIVIDLARNFRSRQSVITDTNAVFSRLMDQRVGEVDYNEDQQLYYGARFDNKVTTTALNIIVKEEVEEPAAESEWMVEKINSIVNHEQVYDMKTQSYRPAQYKDIVILQRSLTNAEVHQTVMKKYGIPFHVNSRTGYFQTDEIRTIMSLCRTIDNPLQDNHLVGVLRSLLFQFTEQELAVFRLTGKDEYFFNNLLAYRDLYNNELSTKVNHFVQLLEEYRRYARTLSVRELLERIYEQLYVPEKYAILTGGLQRKANLLGLLAKAEDFERSSYRGLFQFIRYVDHMLEEGRDFGEVNIVSEESDVVRLMTVHSSKGLEFPFVIYADLGKGFNQMDSKKSIILNQSLGLAINYYDPVRHLSYPTVLTHLFKQVAQVETISEEMRLMYVAFTRAKEQLILLGSASQKELDAWQHIKLDERLDDYFRSHAPSPLALITAAVMNEARADSTVMVDVITELPVIISNEQLLNLSSDTKDVSWLSDRQHYIYQWLEQNKLPTKESVSDIKRQTEVDDDATTWSLVNQYQLARAEYNRPKFMTEQKRTSAERGTLMHTIMQHFKYTGREQTIEEMTMLLQELVEKKIIAGSDVKEINSKALVEFTKTELYHMISNAEERYMELPFVIGKSYLTDDVPEDTPMEQLVQGMIDCVFKYQGQYYFVDFKTDRFNTRLGNTDQETAMQLAERYSVQMKYYKRALEVILNEQVKGYLYFFDYKEVQLS